MAIAITQTLLDKIKTQLNIGLQKSAKGVFDLSLKTEQCYCPVDTGFLKMSGKIIMTNNGAMITFSSPYARDVEFGIAGNRPIQGIQVIHVPQHRKSDGTIVPAHDMTYKDKKLIRIKPKYSKYERGEPIYRVITEEKERTGQYFLTRATQDYLKTQLIKDLADALRPLGNVIIE
jgi:hypothetical protein